MAPYPNWHKYLNMKFFPKENIEENGKAIYM